MKKQFQVSALLATPQPYVSACGDAVGTISGRFLKFCGSSQTWTTMLGCDEDDAWTWCASPDDTKPDRHRGSRFVWKCQRKMESRVRLPNNP